MAAANYSYSNIYTKSDGVNPADVLLLAASCAFFKVSICCVAESISVLTPVGLAFRF